MTYPFSTPHGFLLSPHRLLASGLCLGIVGILGVTVPSPVLLSPTLAQTQTRSSTNITAEDLVGAWEGELAPDQPITWIFTRDGKLFMTAPPPPDTQQRAIELRYQLDPNTQPMGINISLMKDATVMTIFEFTPDGQMRVQIAGTVPGEERPTEFNNATLFKKVSSSTTLPENTEIDDFESRSQ